MSKLFKFFLKKSQKSYIFLFLFPSEIILNKMGVKATKVTNSIKRTSDNDDAHNITDSFFEDTSSSLSALSLYEFTITSNFDTYLYLDGRKFYNISSYILPSDVMETRRSDFTHELYKRRWYGNYSSPVDELLKAGGGRVLECG